MNAHHDSQSKKKRFHFSSFNGSFFRFLVEYLIGSTVFPLWSFLPPFWPKAVKSSFFFWTDLKWIDHRLLQTVKSVTRQWAYSFKLWSERKKKGENVYFMTKSGLGSDHNEDKTFLQYLCNIN